MSQLIIKISEQPLPQLKKLLKQLGGERKIAILKKLTNGKNMTITDIAKEMDCGKANISQQVSELEKAGLIIKQVSKTAGSNLKFIKPAYNEIIIKLK